jgi:hypothetical protein
MADVVENLNVLAKEVFGDKGVPDLIPDMTKIQKEIPFSKGEQLGLKFAQTVRLAYPNGFTHQKGDGTAGAFSFQNAKPGAQGRAEMFGYQTLLRDQMSYEDAAKLTGSKASFAKGTEFFFKGLQMSMRKRLEVQFLHGGQGVGSISGTPATSGSNKVITITTAQWCPGVWAGNEGMELDAYNGSTLINTNAVLTVVSSDPVARTVTVSGNATDLGNLANTHTLYYRGAYGLEMTGVHGILANTGSLFNIDASVYSLWKSTQYAPTAGALTFAKVKKAIAQAVSKGLDEDVTLFMHPNTWDDVNSDIAALRRTSDKDVKKVDIGSEEIYYHSQNGVTKLVPSIYCKEGFAYGLCNPKQNWMRIGAADVTMNTPGFEGDLFLHLPSAAGVEARSYTHQAILCLAPAKQFIISNIVNTAL